MPSDSRPPETHELKLGEAALVYCADFSSDPAVTGGATLSSVVGVTAENGKVTVGLGPQINTTAPFIQYDDDGTTPLFTVPQSKGVKFSVTAVTKGQCKVSVQVLCSDGQKPIVDVLFNVK